MFEAFIVLGFIFIVLISAELLWRFAVLEGELSRKLTHVIVGTFIASWPFFMTFQTIRWLSLALLAIVTLSKALSVFKSVHAVPRPTLGEVFFPISVFLISFLTTSPWVFAAAIIHMSIADGLAAIIGTLYRNRFNLKGTYKVIGQIKTVVGTMAFFICSALITIFVVTQSPYGVVQGHEVLLLSLPIIATVLENYSVYGADNLSVPLLVTVVLNNSLVF